MNSLNTLFLISSLCFGKCVLCDVRDVNGVPGAVKEPFLSELTSSVLFKNSSYIETTGFFKMPVNLCLSLFTVKCLIICTTGFLNKVFRRRAFSLPREVSCVCDIIDTFLCKFEQLLLEFRCMLSKLSRLWCSLLFRLPNVLRFNCFDEEDVLVDARCSFMSKLRNAFKIESWSIASLFSVYCRRCLFKISMFDSFFVLFF